jgi:hypothetical protein
MSLNEVSVPGPFSGVTKTGRPLVDHKHLARIEKTTRRNLQKGKPGRKTPDSMK